VPDRLGGELARGVRQEAGVGDDGQELDAGVVRARVDGGDRVDVGQREAVLGQRRARQLEERLRAGC
jgi:hypothetical protein